MKDIVVLYHRNCPDGFGGAYAAWKKFGDSADYIAMAHGQVPPEGLEGKEVYCIDYTFKKEVMLELEKRAKRLVVLDHHIGIKDGTEAVREHVFDNDRSGASIAWTYFHPETPLPRMIHYIEDNDINRNILPHVHEVSSFISIQPYEFGVFDTLCHTMETEEGFRDIVERGGAYREYLNYVADFLAGKGEEVEFEGHKVFAVNVQGTQAMRDEVGRRLYRNHQRPFAIVWLEDSKGRGYSMRGDGSVDLSTLAQKYGGNGHKGAASFRLRSPKEHPFVYTTPPTDTSMAPAVL